MHWSGTEAQWDGTGKHQYGTGCSGMCQNGTGMYWDLKEQCWEALGATGTG